MSLPAWLAANTTVPTPVTVTVLPEILAGPDFTFKTTGNLLLAKGEVTAKGALPSFFGEIAVKAPIVWVAFETVKLVVTSVTDK